MKRSSFGFRFIFLGEESKRVAVIVDYDDENSISVTNNIENISRELPADTIIYLDTMKVWNFWSKELGFKTLHIKNGLGSDELIPPPTLDIALEIAKAKYLGGKE